MWPCVPQGRCDYRRVTREDKSSDARWAKGLSGWLGWGRMRCGGRLGRRLEMRELASGPGRVAIALIAATAVKTSGQVTSGRITPSACARAESRLTKSPTQEGRAGVPDRQAGAATREQPSDATATRS